METVLDQKKQIVKYFLAKNLLLDTKQIQQLQDPKLVKTIFEKIQNNEQVDTTVFKEEGLPLTRDPSTARMHIVYDYQEASKKRSLLDFVDMFNDRFKSLERILKNRTELQNLTSISRIAGKTNRESVAFIGMVVDKAVTKNQNIVLTLEDKTGIMKVLINKNKPAMYDAAKDIVYDEVIGINGLASDNIVFANSVYFPDVPLTKELKKAPDEAYAVFISDIHVGSKYFFADQFSKFIRWLRGEEGTDEQKGISKKVKYLFIIGDLVDGIGIYPGQENELTIHDIYDQYKAFAEYIRQVPKDIQIFICPGNHDAMRLAEPQLQIYEDVAQPLLEIENVNMVSNPAIINIHASEHFSGFDVLMYHGYSFDYYASNVESIRMNGAYERADLIMKFLLQRRHLAPTHTSTLYIPSKKDHLIIEKVPDFLVTGHIHRTNVSQYRNVTMLSGSCWQDVTTFQTKVGHIPEPCRVPIINLQTRNVKIMRF